MWESICLTLEATAGDNIGKVLQTKGTGILAPLSFKFKLSDRFLAAGILSIFSHFYLKETMNAVDWMGITLAGIGTIGNELVLVVRSKRLLPYLYFTYRGWPFLSPSCLWNIKWLKKLYMVWNLAFCLGWHLSSKIGFLFLEQGFPKMLVPTCTLMRAFVVETRGSKHVRAIVVSTCAAMLALGEKLPSAPTARLSLLLGWLLIIVGVILPVSSTRLVQLLPQPLRRIIASGGGVDRNHTVRQTGSIRSSSAIQAATLHRLISTSSKEKA